MPLSFQTSRTSHHMGLGEPHRDCCAHGVPGFDQDLVPQDKEGLCLAYSVWISEVLGREPTRELQRRHPFFACLFYYEISDPHTRRGSSRTPEVKGSL